MRQERQIADSCKEPIAMTLAEASFDVARQLSEIAAIEARMPHVTGIHSMSAVDDGNVSIWFDLDTRAGPNEGVVIVRVAAHEITGLGHDEIMQAVVGTGLTRH
jgi:hypothetical protein